MKAAPIRRIQLLGFVEEVRHVHSNMPDRRFCFVLGAGASKTSLIPTAGELGLDWLKKIHTEGDGAAGDFAKWLNDGAHGIEGLPPKTSVTDIATIAAAYPAIYRAKWGHDRAQGDAEIERHIEKGRPSYGYYALAEILASDEPANPSRHNVVITPNFDNLPAETLGALGKKIPIVIGHSAITEFARPTMRRPLIIKFHHDFLLSPKSDLGQVDRMEGGYARALAEIFRLYTPIVIGYGGNDGSLMGLMEKLEGKSIPGGILWCWRKGDPPGHRIEEVVAKQAGTFIEIPGFDELMTLLEEPFGHVFNPDKLSERAAKRAQELKAAKERLTKKAESGLSPSAPPAGSGERGATPPITATGSAESSAVLDALSAVTVASKPTRPRKKAALSWWRWQARINAATALDEKERLFNQGLEATQNAVPLLGNYAIFLGATLKDDTRAEEFFLKALAADPNHARILGGYASFLSTRRKDDARAEEYYLKAVAADPNDAVILHNYAIFLETKRKDAARAEEYYLKALAADPSDADLLGNYAMFLDTNRKDDSRAEEYYLKALAADPNHARSLGSYAGFLSTRRKDDTRAEEYYLKALAADPNDAINLNNYAIFLETRRKDDARAEEYYLKAIAADPSDADFLDDYATFLETQRKDDARAEEYYLKAIAADPKNADNLSNYATFLSTRRKDDARAEEYYLKAIAADPKNADNLSNYATFLSIRRKDDARAEEYHLKAIAADSNHANNLSNYAAFLETNRKDDARAEEYHLKAVAADPNDAGLLGNYAIFLETRRKDDARAEEYYLKAIAADPSDADLLGNYASFLSTRRKDDARAEEYYLKAIAADSNHANNLSNYATFLETNRKDDARAEEYHLKAVAADPSDNNLNNYAQFLIGRERFAEAAPLASRAWALLMDRSCMVAGEVLFSLWLLAAIAGADGARVLGRLKTLLQADYPRYPWNFDAMLAACLPKMTDEQGMLTRKLAAAVLDAARLAELDGEAGWRSMRAVPLDAPLPDDSAR